jgi:hypothetical protein
MALASIASRILRKFQVLNEVEYRRLGLFTGNKNRRPKVSLAAYAPEFLFALIRWHRLLLLIAPLFFTYLLKLTD